MSISVYQVEAFTSEVFRGNPAAVCVLDDWLPDKVLQNIAGENNLSETAFIVDKGEFFDLRWFTPKIEVDLCGHATLASAFIVFSFLKPELQSINFNTASGVLKVEKSDQGFSMYFPSLPPERISPPLLLTEALGMLPMEVLKSRDLLAIFENESQIRQIKPNFEKLSRIHDCLGVIVSAPGDATDFVSRFFAPNAGILEDHVTGSTHCTLAPYWSKQLKLNRMRALQLSDRGGELICEVLGSQIKIYGQAVLFLKGEIFMENGYNGRKGF